MTPETDALWGRALCAWETGSVTIEELCRIVGAGKTTVYERLGEARGRRELAEGPTEGGPPEIDEATWLELVTGASRTSRPCYDLDSDTTTLDGTEATVLVGGGSCSHESRGSGRHRRPRSPSAGQRLLRRNLASGREADRDAEEPKSEGFAVNRKDRTKHIKYVQPVKGGESHDRPDAAGGAAAATAAGRRRDRRARRTG